MVVRDQEPISLRFIFIVIIFGLYFFAHDTTVAVVLYAKYRSDIISSKWVCMKRNFSKILISIVNCVSEAGPCILVSWQWSFQLMIILPSSSVVHVNTDRGRKLMAFRWSPRRHVMRCWHLLTPEQLETRWTANRFTARSKIKCQTNSTILSNTLWDEKTRNKGTYS